MPDLDSLSLDQQLALHANFFNFAISNQRIRHLAESVLNRPLIVDEENLSLGLGESHIRF